MMPRLLSYPALLALAAVPLLAQADDPPSRVARLNFLSGTVSFRPGSVEEWTAATLNYPLTIGDHLWADADGRVELHTGSAAIRMSARTAIAILNLDDRTAQLSLTDGSLHIRLRHLEEDETFEVDTPNVAITLLRPGEYRIDANGDASMTSVTVRSGNAEVTGGGTAFAVRPRETGRATGMDSVTQDVQPALPASEFDFWCEARDRREEEDQASAQYVPRDMVGYEDLGRNGVWSDEPDYGWVWRPRVVDAGWAPYRFGHWAWVEPWGWTWIDDAPWGFAPFHYGRWASLGGGWVWVPGRMAVGVRPVYAPALVVFVGTPGFAGAAWFPLGPREVYRPAYHVSEVYVRRVNVMHVSNVAVVNTVYVNQRIPGAVTVVSHETFVGARPVGRSLVVMDNREFGRAQVIGTAAPIAPGRVSVLGRSGPAIAPPPGRFVERQVVVRRAPPAPPVSFEARRQALDANPGRPLEPAQMDRFRGGAPRNPQVRMASPAAPGIPPRTEPGRPAMAPREERPAMRPPVQQTEPSRVERPQRTEPAPAATPRVERPQRTEPAPGETPRVDRPQRTEPAPGGTPRADRPQRTEPAPAATEHKRERREDRRDERKANNRRNEKKDDK